MMKSKNPNVRQRTEFLTEEHKLEGQFALAAFATMKAKKILYVSIPITSGKRLYDFMKKYGFKTIDEAKLDKSRFFTEVIEPNIAEGKRISDAWAAKTDGVVVAPAEFEGRLHRETHVTWGQDAFMSMWIPMIDEKITHMVMIDGWEYSNGSGEEYLQAALMQMGRAQRRNIEVTDEAGRPIPLDKGIDMVATAVRDLHARGLRPRNMAETLARLLEAEHRFSMERTLHRSVEPDNRTAPHGTVLPYNREKIRGIRREMRLSFSKLYPDIFPTLDKMSSFDYSPANELFRKPVRPSLVRQFA